MTSTADILRHHCLWQRSWTGEPTVRSVTLQYRLSRSTSRSSVSSKGYDYRHYVPVTLWNIIIQLWTFYSVNMVWYLLNLTVLTEAEPRSILSNSVNIRPYLLSKMSITVFLYSLTIYERYVCSNLKYGLMFRIITRFHTVYFGASCVHRNSIVWRRVILARFPYWPVKRMRRISRYSCWLETLISSEYGLIISGHVTVLRQWLLEINTDYI